MYNDGDTSKVPGVEGGPTEFWVPEEAYEDFRKTIHGRGQIVEHAEYIPRTRMWFCFVPLLRTSYPPPPQR